MTEDPRNWGYVHPECAPKADPEGIYSAKPPEFFVGKFAKIAFNDGGPDDRSEYMWILVKGTDRDDRELWGELNNDPQLVQNWEIGDEVSFNRNEIRQVLSEGKFI
jgi:uncharacterized protein YegJ (DUF2314 family)